MNPYIPARDAEFLAWLNVFADAISAAPASFGLLAADGTAIDAARDSFVTAYDNATDPATRTIGSVATKDAARANAEAVVRPYAQRIKANPTVTNANKLAVGLNINAAPPTPIVVPATAPTIGLIAASPGVHTLSYGEPGAAGKAKPYGAIGVQLFRGVGAAPINDPALLGFNAILTKSPATVETAGLPAGQLATYRARWMTRSGTGGSAQFGPWSAPLTVAVV